MSTATKSKAPANIESWAEWLDQLDTLHAERAENIGLSEARETLSRAKNKARYVIGLASSNHNYPGKFSHDPSGDDTDALLDTLGQILSDQRRAFRTVNWHKQSPQRQAYIKDLADKASQATTGLEKAADEAATLEEARSEVEKRLETLEQSAPKASASGLDALRKDRDAAAVERDRIATALSNMTADASPLALAREAERTAQERLEEAEAMVAMGEANGEEVKTAQAETKKASQALEREQAEHRRQDTARRGLTRKLEQAGNRLDTLARAYQEALGRVRHADLMALEGELVADLERIAADRLGKLAAIYADLEEAEPGSDYGRAVIEVKLPHFHHHEGRDMLNSYGLTLTAHGVEE